MGWISNMAAFVICISTSRELVVKTLQFKFIFELTFLAPHHIFCSSVGQSERLLTVRSEVRALPGENFCMEEW